MGSNLIRPVVVSSARNHDLASKKEALICIPCYNHSNQLIEFLSTLKNTSLQKNPWSQIDLLILDDGSGEAEQSQLVTRLQNQNLASLNLSYHLNAKNQGKGAVLRQGFAYGITQPYEYIGFMDADGATPEYEILNLLNHLKSLPTLDAVIGTRLKCLGKNVRRSFKRHLSGRIFATLVSEIFSIPVYDSQCGAKLFKKSILNSNLLLFCDDSRWLFDTQLLIMLYKQGAKIHEFPVDWTHQPDSKVSMVRDSFHMLTGLLKFRKKSNLQ